LLRAEVHFVPPSPRVKESNRPTSACKAARPRYVKTAPDSSSGCAGHVKGCAVVTRAGIDSLNRFRANPGAGARSGRKLSRRALRARTAEALYPPTIRTFFATWSPLFSSRDPSEFGRAAERPFLPNARLAPENTISPMVITRQAPPNGLSRVRKKKPQPSHDGQKAPASGYNHILKGSRSGGQRRRNNMTPTALANKTG